MKWVRKGRSKARPTSLAVPATLLSAVLFACLAGPWILPDGFRQDLESIWLPPLSRGANGVFHLLGTDALGRDMTARICLGGRISLLVGFVATGVAVVIGLVYGSFAGLSGPRLDNLLMRFVDAVYTLPYMFLVIALMAWTGQRSLGVVFLALGMVQWLTIARMVRTKIRSLDRSEFSMAAKALGASTGRRLLRHLWPNLTTLLLVYATLTVPQIVLQEAFLSFLGLNASECTWGLLTAEGATSMDVAPWVLIGPALALGVTLLSLHRLGDGLRDRWDPRSR